MSTVAATRSNRKARSPKPSSFRYFEAAFHCLLAIDAPDQYAQKSVRLLRSLGFEKSDFPDWVEAARSLYDMGKVVLKVNKANRNKLLKLDATV